MLSPSDEEHTEKSEVSVLSRSPERESKVMRADNSVGSTAGIGTTGYSGKKNTVLVRDDHIHAGLFAFHEDTKLLFSCGHWDHSLKVTAIETCRILQSVTQHRDVITCLSLSSDYRNTWLVSGSRDCTVMIWEVVLERESNPVTEIPLFTLFGHDDSVTSVRVCPTLNIVASGSDDGTIILHTLREGTYIRSIVVDRLVVSSSATPLAGVYEANMDSTVNTQQDIVAVHNKGRRRVNWLDISPDGVLVVYLLDEFLLCSYTVNGRQLASRTIKDKLHALLLSSDGKVLVTGGNNGLVVLRWVSIMVF